MNREDFIKLGLKGISEIVKESKTNMIYFYSLPDERLRIIGDKMICKEGGRILKDSERLTQANLEQEFTKSVLSFNENFEPKVIYSANSPLPHHGNYMQINDEEVMYTTLTKQPFLRTEGGRLSKHSPYSLYQNMDSKAQIRPKLQFETPFIHSDVTTVRTLDINTFNPSEARGQIMFDKSSLYTSFRSIKFALFQTHEIFKEHKGNKQLIVTTLPQKLTNMDYVGPRADSMLVKKIKHATALSLEIKKFSLTSKFEERLVYNILINCPRDHTCVASHVDYTTGRVVHIYVPETEIGGSPSLKLVQPIELSTLLDLFSISN